MASSVSASSSQSTNSGANQSTVNGYGSVTITVGYFSGMQSYGRVWIGGQNYDIAGPTSMSQGSSWSWSASRTYNHDANGYRGDVGVSVEFWVDGTSLHAGSAGAATQGAIDYDRKPSSPGAVSATVNSNTTISVAVQAVSSPAGTPTYYVQWSQNGGAYQGTQSSTGTSFTFSGLLPGQTYQFRAYATNSDGTGGTTYSSTVFLPSGGKRYDGTAFVTTQLARRYTGTGWQDLSIAKRYNGTDWVDLS